VTRPQRSDWIDVAKGVCIVLVVLWHVIMKHYLQIGWSLPVPLPGLWGGFGEILLPLRMPVFFTISGMLAANAAQRPWRAVVRSRVAKFFYLYALWFTVHTAVLALAPDFDTLAAGGVLDVVEQLTITPTNLWYLIALAVYFVVAKSTRSLPTVAVLAPALLLSAIASAGLLAAPGNRGQLYQNLLFFLIGLRFKPWVERWARTATLRLFLTAAAAYLVATLAIEAIGAQRWFGVWPVVSLIAVLAGIAGAVRLARVRRLRGPLTALGRNTLPIYVMHMPLLALMDLALRDPLSRAGPAVQLAFAAGWPVAAAALLITVCLTLHRFLLAARCDWLFDLPRRRTPQQPSVGDQQTRELPIVEQPTMWTPINRTARINGRGNPPNHRPKD